MFDKFVMKKLANVLGCVYCCIMSTIASASTFAIIFVIAGERPNEKLLWFVSLVALSYVVYLHWNKDEIKYAKRNLIITFYLLWLGFFAMLLKN